jgi:hypothetical protein
VLYEYVAREQAKEVTSRGDAMRLEEGGQRSSESQPSKDNFFDRSLHRARNIQQNFEGSELKRVVCWRRRRDKEQASICHIVPIEMVLVLTTHWHNKLNALRQRTRTLG